MGLNKTWNITEPLIDTVNGYHKVRAYRMLPREDYGYTLAEDRRFTDTDSVTMWLFDNNPNNAANDWTSYSGWTL